MELFFRKNKEDNENCFYIESSKPLNENEINTLKWLLGETFDPNGLKKESHFESRQNQVVELGPRLNFQTPFSTNAISICQACGLDSITRLEKSRRFLIPGSTNLEEFISKNHDRMTECHYDKPLSTFKSSKPESEEVFEVQLIEKGKKALEKINREMGLGMDEWDLDFYHKLFTITIGRNPTNIECFQLGQANSEHSRHWFFKGKLIIDGFEMPETLLQIVMSTLKANPQNSIIAFKDNSSAIAGYCTQTITPREPGKCCAYTKNELVLNPILTAETHNFPSGIAPFPGAQTGTGGRIRDIQATGTGAHVVAGTAGYCVGNLNLPDHSIPGENQSFEYPSKLASPASILIQASNGASDYGNKFGEPLIQGFTRTFGLETPWGERREWLKPIMFSGGVGHMDSRHINKKKPEAGMVVVQIGGPAYRIGMGGGSASSMIQGENKENLDFDAVQRGDAEMEQKMNRVIRACIELGDQNPILSIHDQGAGGPCNVLTELIEPEGGKIEIRKIELSDKTLSLIEIWGAEYQERNALLISPNRLEDFLSICTRERVTAEILGEVTGDGQIVVHDEKNDENIVDLNLSLILGDMPQKTFVSNHIPKVVKPTILDSRLTVEDALESIFRLPSVGSKGFLVRKVDRSVTGLIAQQQCCGPLQLPVSNVAVTAHSHFGITGTALGIGEQPLKILVEPKAGARMCVGELLLNMVWAKISDLKHIKCSVNWMWAAKLPGEGALMYDAATAMRDIMIDLEIAADGGKDSLSMAAKVADETIKAPGQMVISGYATVPDINKVITPDIKQPGKSSLLFIDLSGGKKRLGGSALAQAYGQVGDLSPDIENTSILKNTFNTIQELIEDNKILAGHDISDGGLITTLAEMTMSGNCGAQVKLPMSDSDIFAQLFAEELGVVIEYLPENEPHILDLLKNKTVPCKIIGKTSKEKRLKILSGNSTVVNLPTNTLLKWWEATSDRLEQEQASQACTNEQPHFHSHTNPSYHLTFEPTLDSPKDKSDKPKVAIIREEGSNGDREMSSAFHSVDFEVWDINMTDLLSGQATLDQYRGVVFVGGFSYADVLDSAKGWAGAIKFNPKLKKEFDNFYIREDTFSLGVCNGCQLMALLGWVPWKGTEGVEQPRFIRNRSERFESRWVTTKIEESPAIMLKDMTGSTLGVWVAHGEGRLHCPKPQTLYDVHKQNLVPLVYVDDTNQATEKYPFNPNGSPLGTAGLCSPCGRHLAMMPHPERVFRLWQWAWMPEDWKQNLKTSPWIKMFQNAREWCDQ